MFHSNFFSFNSKLFTFVDRVVENASNNNGFVCLVPREQIYSSISSREFSVSNIRIGSFVFERHYTGLCTEFVLEVIEKCKFQVIYYRLLITCLYWLNSLSSV